MISNIPAIDAHCHIYPDAIAPRAVAGTDAFYGTVAECDGTVAGLERIYEAGRIHRFLVHSVATTPHQVHAINEFIAKMQNRLPELLLGFGSLHPESEDLAGDFHHLAKLGLRGVKIHPDIQKFKLDDEKCLLMYELCQAHGLPILIHTGDYRYDYSNPCRMEPVLKRFPDLLVIGAHMGGWSVWEEAYQRLSPYPNFYVDCSSTFRFWEPEKARELILRWGADRVIFGSDYPMWDPHKELDTLLSFGFPEKDLEKILWGNLTRLLAL